MIRCLAASDRLLFVMGVHAKVMAITRDQNYNPPLIYQVKPKIAKDDVKLVYSTMFYDSENEKSIYKALEKGEGELKVLYVTPEKISKKWRKTLNKVFPVVVVLRTTCTRAFDTEVERSSNDTSFIVDKTRWINHRVVNPRPIFVDATFLNREEIPVYPLYRDPVHDFGFLHFDPTSLQFMKCEEIPLAARSCDGWIGYLSGG